MANTFYIKQGANNPSLTTTLSGESGSPMFLDGTVILRLKHPIYGTFDFEAEILDQDDTATKGMVKIADVGVNPDTDEPMSAGNYACEFRYTNSLNKLSIFPTESSPYDLPTTDLIVIQKAL